MMTRREAEYEVKLIHGKYSECRRVVEGHKFRYLVGRMGSDRKFHCEGSGSSWHQAVIQLYMFQLKMRKQMELAL